MIAAAFAADDGLNPASKAALPAAIPHVAAGILMKSANATFAGITKLFFVQRLVDYFALFLD